MMDQASRLREIATELYDTRFSEQNTSILDTAKEKNYLRAQVFAITSGKGGVGKTHIAVNLAIKIQEAGYKVLLIDADVNLANTDILMGNAPGQSLADAIIKDYSIRDVIYTGPEDLHILPGGSGFAELVDLPAARQARIIRQLQSLEYIYDYFILDTPAGIHKHVLDFVSYATYTIVVATPEPTSIADAYAMVKVMTLQQNGTRIYILINQAESQEHAREVFSKFKLVVDRFLKIRVRYIGGVLNDRNVVQATIKQKPLVLAFPKSTAARCICAIAERIVARGNIRERGTLWNPADEDRGSFFQRLAKISIFQ